MKKRWLAALLSLCMTVTMVPVGAMAADIENDIAESPVNLTEIVPQDPSALDEQPVSPETNLLEESEPAEDEPKAEMVAEVEGKQYETLEAAIEAAQDKDTLTLLSNVSLRDHIIIRDKQITIDTAGYDVVYTADASHKEAVIDLNDNADVVLQVTVHLPLTMIILLIMTLDIFFVYRILQS